MSDLRVVITRDMDDDGWKQASVAQALDTLAKMAKLLLGASAGVSIIVDGQACFLAKQPSANVEPQLLLCPSEVF